MKREKDPSSGVGLYMNRNWTCVSKRRRVKVGVDCKRNQRSFYGATLGSLTQRIGANALEEPQERADETSSAPAPEDDDEKQNGLGISFGEVDSAVSGLEKLGLSRVESSGARKPAFDEKGGSLSFLSSPQSA